MIRALVLATLLSVDPRAVAQAVSVLHIKIVLVDADGKATPVPRHALLVSDNPSTATPRRIVTAIDGTVDVRLRPGNYTVESDEPVAFHGKSYQWTQMLDIVAGRDAILELTAANAEVATTTSAVPLENDPWLQLPQWLDSVVAIWTPTTHASGFVIDANGLVATNQRAIGAVTSVEVQLTPAVKVAGSVVEADAARDVAVLRIDSKALASARPVPLKCGPSNARVVDGQRIFSIGAPLRQEKGITPGAVSRQDANAIVSDLALATGGAGGPVFTAGGDVVGLTSARDETGERGRGDTPIVRVDDVCAVVAAAEKRLKDARPPAGKNLPVEPAPPFPVDALRDAVKGRAGSLSPYQMVSSDFDIAFITPVMIYGAQQQGDVSGGRRTGAVVTPNSRVTFVRPLMDFGYWSEYVADFPAVLLIRVTPKLVEGFWTKVARGAAQAQGVALPPIKRMKSGFSRMRAFCGDSEVTPIHPFKLEQRVSEVEAIDEGLYVFDPGALGPTCASVKLVLYSEKEPEKADARLVDPKVLQQIWRDFASYRALR
jgi:S1-C subfamily serine protease